MREYVEPNESIAKVFARFPILNKFGSIAEYSNPPGPFSIEFSLFRFDAELVNQYLGYHFCDRSWTNSAENVNKILNEIERKDGHLEIRENQNND